MRVFSVFCAFLILACIVAAQTPAAKPQPPSTAKPTTTAKPAPAPARPAARTTAKPVGTLAQVMRGILFPNSNILFDVQSKDPETFGKREEGGGATSTFSGIYTGWQVVENAAVALNEATRLLSVPGRVCENGNPVPIDQKDWAPFIDGLRMASEKMLKAAQAKNREAASDTTNDVAEACGNCHEKYRDAPPRCMPK